MKENIRFKKSDDGPSGIILSFRMLIAALLLLPAAGWGQNPVIQTIYTADPAPMVHNDTVYVYTTHDEDNSTWFTMNEWRVYASGNMVNWTDYGSPLSLEDFSWADENAWAAQCIYRNGKYYFYICANHKELNRMAIGVAVADSPTGPFVPPYDEPLVAANWGDIDPSVFIDDDGQAYLYWGNPNLYYVKLNEDMISYDKELGVVQEPLTEEGFKLRVLHAHKTFSWARSIDGLASHSVKEESTNTYYWYVSARDENNRKVIAVGKGDKAIGPFKDVLGKPLVAGIADKELINPTVVVDGAGKSYLTWGNSSLWYVQLGDDMASYDKKVGIVEVPEDKKEWFVSKINGETNSTGKRYTTYEEGPWLYKRDSLYYLLYPAGGVPEHLAYSTSKSPTGPWIYRDTIMPVIEKGGAFTNHPGIIDFKGKSYLFYHDASLSGGNGFERSVCVEPFAFNPDGSIPRIRPTKEGVLVPAAHVDPYRRVEAETIAWEEGVETQKTTSGNIYVTDIHNGDYIKVRSVDFGKGAKTFEATVAAMASGAKIEIRKGGLNGTLLGTLDIKKTGGEQQWKTQSVRVTKITGVHDIFFVFKGGEDKLFNFDWWQFR